MATLSWKRGQFGLSSLQFVAEPFNGDLMDEFQITFSEDKGDKFTGITQQSDPTFASITQQSDPTFTGVTQQSDPTFTNVYSVT